MLTLEDLSRQIVEAADRDDAILDVHRLSETSWILQFEGNEIGLDWDASSDCLMFRAVIGPPPVEQREAILTALLSYNMLYRETGGIRVAMAGPEGDVALLVDLPKAQLTQSQIITTAADVDAKARGWAAVFERTRAQPDSAQPHSSESMIQV